MTLLPDFQDPKKPRWASVSPDDSTIVFARGHNLFMMDAANYAKARVTPGDESIAETQIAADGEEHFGYDRRPQDEDKRALRRDSKDDKHKMGQRVPSVQIFWARDSKRFAVVRRDERKVADLFVINALSTPRPTLETYRYELHPVVRLRDLGVVTTIVSEFDDGMRRSSRRAKPMEAAGPVDAQTAPTGPCKTTERFCTATTGPSHSFLSRAKNAGRLSPR